VHSLVDYVVGPRYKCAGEMSTDFNLTEQCLSISLLLNCHKVGLHEGNILCETETVILVLTESALVVRSLTQNHKVPA